MSDADSRRFIIRDRNWHPKALTPDYKTSVPRSPRQALVSGADGLHDIRRIIAAAPEHLAPGAWLLLEHGWDQAAAARALLSDSGWAQVQSRRDLAGVERCSGGQWPL